MAGRTTTAGHVGLTSRSTIPLPGSGGAPVDASGNLITEDQASKKAEPAIASETTTAIASDNHDSSDTRSTIPSLANEHPWRYHEKRPPPKPMPCRVYSPIEYNEANFHLGRTKSFKPAENAKEVGPVSEESLTNALQKLDGMVITKYGDPGAPPVPTIYKVPGELKNTDGYRDYHPVAVCIGCFAGNRREYDTQEMEEYKWCCVRQLIGRNKHRLEEPAKTRELLRACLTTMNHILPRVRESYSGHIVYNDNALSYMMLLDGCFILHRLLKYARRRAESGPADGDDDWTQIFGRCWVWQLVTRDLLLLENQIPFFVIEELFLQLKNEDESEDLLFGCSLRLFRSMGLQMRELSHIERDNVKHLMHLFYMSFGLQEENVPKPSQQELDVFLPDLSQWVPSAKELEEAGVRFRKKRDAASFLDISFDHRRGVLEIPPLQLYDSSSALFRNLIAFEQAYPATRCNVSTYAVFMDCLINTPEDMRILHLRGILVNQMNGQQDPSRFFSQICAQVLFPADNYLVHLMEKVSKYKESRRHNWRAALVRNYFGNPWLTMSVLAAVLLLALTVLQTFFTVYPYYRPSE